MKETKYWIGIVSKDRMELGREGGFCQLCPGKSYLLKRMKKDGWIIYCSTKTVFMGKMLVKNLLPLVV